MKILQQARIRHSKGLGLEAKSIAASFEVLMKAKADGMRS